MEQRLTIGMAHYNDFDGVFFTIQDIRKELIFNKRYDLLNKIEFLIVENNPTSKHAEEVKSLKHNVRNLRIIDFPEIVGTSASRNKVIEEATGNFVLVLDCHVLLCPVVDTLDKLFQFMEYNADSNDLFAGPLVHDSLVEFSTHFNDSWGGQMWGQWGSAWECMCESANFSLVNDNGKCKFISLEKQEKLEQCVYCSRDFPKGLDWSGHVNLLKNEGYSQIGGSPATKPFEIFAQGLGLFLTRKNSWLKFNEHTRGFGGEECYIHEKYRKEGRKVYNLPCLRWLHRFGRPNGADFPISAENKVRNYLLEFIELGLDLEPVRKHFIEEQGFSGVEFDNILQQVHKIYNKSDKGSSGSNEQILKQILHLKSKLPKNLQAELNKLTVEK